MKKIIWLILSSLIVLSLVLASCGGEEEVTEEETVTEETVTEEPVTEEPATPPAGSNWWDKWGEPQYGGTLTVRGTEIDNWDPYYRGSGDWWYETLATRNFAGIDRETYDFKTRFTPINYHVGLLAENWDIESWDTVTFHIRKGVHWHNKPPMNGRELDAYDIEWSWQRFCAIGSGFTEPAALAGMYRMVTSVTATDKWTVVFKIEEPSIYGISSILDDNINSGITPKEAIELWGDVNDWTRVIGTGPFMPADYVSGVALTTVKNPDYWGYDEHFPDNKLPYIDGFKYMIIPDDATARAALRTGKIDWESDVGWEQMQLLIEQKPDLWIEKFPSTAGGTGMMFLVDEVPFNDIRVRKAMQMSIDLKTIAATYFNGQVDGTPPGFIGTQGYGVPYEEWPQDVKDGYAYNPEGAKALLAEAGYPNGIKCNLAISSSSDLDLAQIVQSYFADIGIDMTIDVMEPTVFNSYTRASKAPMSWQNDVYVPSVPPVNAISFRSPYHSFYTRHHIDDPVYNDIYFKMSSSLDMEEQKQLGREADLYVISKHWTVTLLPRFSYTLIWPWVKGYNGEITQHSRGVVYSRLWIDEELQKSMGY
jgi:peptide/nickel transport system substrate-binding protein